MRTFFRTILSVALLFALMAVSGTVNAQTQEQIDEINQIEKKIQANKGNDAATLELTRHLVTKKLEYGMITRLEAAELLNNADPNNSGNEEDILKDVVLIWPSSVKAFVTDPYKVEPAELIGMYQREIAALKAQRDQAEANGQPVEPYNNQIQAYELMILKVKQLTGIN